MSELLDDLEERRRRTGKNLLGVFEKEFDVDVLDDGLDDDPSKPPFVAIRAHRAGAEAEYMDCSRLVGPPSFATAIVTCYCAAAGPMERDGVSGAA